jgi:hypothetical protein
MHLIRCTTALVEVAQRFEWVVPRLLLPVVAVVVVMVAHPTAAVAAAPRESPVVEATAAVVVLSRQGEREGTHSDRMAPPVRHFSVDVAMTRAAAAAVAGLVVAAAATTLVVEVALVMFRY